MGLETGKEIIDRFDSVRQKRTTFESEWQECADNMFGRRDFLEINEPGGRRRTSNILDTTARQSLIQLAGGLQGLLADPSTPWMSIGPVDDDLKRDPSSNFWFEDSTRRMRNAFAEPRAGFSVNMAEIFYDIGGFGTSAMFTVDQGTHTYFSARPLGEIFIEEDELGIIDLIFRRFQFTARQAAQAFGDASTGATGVKAIDDALTKDPDKKLWFIHLIHHVDDPSARPGRQQGAEKPWRSVYVAEESKGIISEGGYYELPVHVARWSREAGEVYGRGPGMTALSDGMMLNEMKRTLLTLAQKVADPPLLVPDDGVMTQVVTTPGGINIIREDLMVRSRGVPIATLPTGANFPITQEILNETRQSVRETFFATLMQLFRDPRMTATQVLELSAEAQRMMAPMLSRLKVELLDPMVQRQFFLMLRRGQLAPIPEVLKGRDFEVTYNSPVLRSQRLPEARATMEVWQSAATIAQMGAPQIMDGLDADASLAILHEARGAPISILRSEEERDQLREQRAIQAQQAQELEQLTQASEAAGNIGLNVPELAAGQQQQ